LVDLGGYIEQVIDGVVRVVEVVILPDNGVLACRKLFLIFFEELVGLQVDF
jgi:hypothetical protein